MLVPAFLLVFGLALTALASISAWRATERETHAAFHSAADDLIGRVEEQMWRATTSVDTLAALFHSSSRVEEDEFDRFGATMLQTYPAIDSVAWVVPVSGPGRAALVEAQRSGTRHTGFDIMVPDPDGVQRPAPPADRYAVTLFAVTREAYSLHGNDVASEPGRRAMLDAARDTGRTIGSAIVGRVNHAPTVMLARALYRPDAPTDNAAARQAGHIGWVVARFRVDRLIAEARNRSRSGLTVQVFEDDDPESVITMGAGPMPGGVAATDADLSNLRRSGAHVHPIALAGRTWHVAVEAPPPPGLAQQTRVAGSLAGIGLILTVGIATYLVTTGTRQRQIEHLAATLGIANEELRHTRDRLERGQQLARFGTWDWTADTGTFLWSSLGFELLGIDPEAPRTLETVLARLTPESVATMREAGRRALAGENAIDVEVQLLPRPGHDVQWVWIRSHVLARGPERVLAMTGTIQDISERKRFEIALENGQARLRLILDHVPDGVLSLADDGSIGTANKAAETMLAAPAGALHGRQLAGLVAQGDAGERRIDAHAQCGNGPFETTLASFDGRVWPAEINIAMGNGDPAAAMVVVVRDLSSRREAERALRERQALIENVSATIPGMLYRYRLERDGRQYLSFATDGIRDLFGLNVTDALADPEAMFRRVAREDRAAFLAEVRRSAEAMDAFHLVFRAEPGTSTRWIDATSLPRATADGAIEWSGIALDHTAWHEMQDQLLQAQKMEAIGQLTGGIAHDFNNLMTVVMGNLELLRDRVAGDPEAEVHADMALKAVDRSAELTQQLLAYSRRQTLAPQLIDLNRLVQTMSSLITRTLGERIAVETAPAGSVWPIFADRAQMESAVLNLAINARDAMPEGGRLTVEATNIVLDDAYAAAQGDVAPGQYVMLAVTDTGTGMTADVKAQAFNPFFTTKEVGKGTGLGLSMVYGFVKQSGGHVRIESEVGHGTTVRLYLPRYRTEARIPARPARPGTSEGRGETILVVEDDADVRLYLKNALARLGYVVVEAADGQQALALFPTLPRIDLLLIDLVLPGTLDGRATAAALQALQPGLRVVIASGYTELPGEAPPADDQVATLVKPFSLDQLARCIRDTLDAAPPMAPTPDPPEVPVVIRD